MPEQDLGTFYLEFRKTVEDEQSPLSQALRQREAQRAKALSDAIKASQVQKQLEPEGTEGPAAEAPLSGGLGGEQEGGEAGNDPDIQMVEPQGDIDKSFVTKAGAAVASDVVTGVKEAPRAVSRGLLKAVANSLTALQDANDFIITLQDSVPGTKGGKLFSEETTKKFKESGAQRFSAQRVLSNIGEGLSSIVDKALPGSESVSAGLVEGLAQFAPVFLGVLGKAGQVPRIARALSSKSAFTRVGGRIARDTVAGVPATFFQFDPSEPRFSNLINELAPSLRNPVTEFLEAPEGSPDEEALLESRLMGRLKAAAEDLAVGPALDGFVELLGRAVRIARRNKIVNRFKNALDGLDEVRAPAIDELDIEELSEEIFTNTKISEGATVNLTEGNLIGTEAYAVGLFPESTKRVSFNEFTQQDVSDFIAENANLFPLESRAISIGTWHDTSTGDVWLDIVTTVKDKELALRLTEPDLGNQKAIFDLKNLEEIPGRGTGEVGAEIVPLEERLRFATSQDSPIPDGSIQNGISTLARFARRLLESAPQPGLSIRDVSRERVPEIIKQNRALINTIGAAAIANGNVSDKALKEAMLRNLPDKVSSVMADDLKEMNKALNGARKRFQQLVDGAMKFRAVQNKDIILPSGKKVGTTETPLPDVERLMELLRVGQFRADWYRDAPHELKNLFGDDAALVADIIAALSPQVPVRDNIEGAIDFYLHYKAGGSVDDWKVPTRKGTNNKLSIGPLPIHLDMLDDAIARRPLGKNAPKARNFSLNLQGNRNVTTIDSWMTHILFGTDAPATRYPFLDHWMRQFANSIGMAPADAQAALWVGAKIIDEGLDRSDPSLKTAGSLIREFAEARGIISQKAEELLASGALDLPAELPREVQLKAAQIHLAGLLAASIIFGDEN